MKHVDEEVEPPHVSAVSVMCVYPCALCVYPCFELFNTHKDYEKEYIARKQNNVFRKQLIFLYLLFLSEGCLPGNSWIFGKY